MRCVAEMKSARASGGRRGLAVTVADEELGWNVERDEQVERLSRHWPGQDVAANDDPIDAGLAHIGEDCLDRREVGVNVEERGDAHRVSIS